MNIHIVYVFVLYQPVLFGRRICLDGWLALKTRNYESVYILVKNAQSITFIRKLENPENNTSKAYQLLEHEVGFYGVAFGDFDPLLRLRLVAWFRG